MVFLGGVPTRELLQMEWLLLVMQVKPSLGAPPSDEVQEKEPVDLPAHF
jgi:hypothetical protein